MKTKRKKPFLLSGLTGLFLIPALSLPGSSYALRTMNSEGVGAEEVRKRLVSAGMEEPKEYEDLAAYGQDTEKKFVAAFWLFEDSPTQGERSPRVYLRVESGQAVRVQEDHPAFRGGFRVADPVSKGDWFVFVRPPASEDSQGIPWELKENPLELSVPDDYEISPAFFRGGSIRMERKPGRGVLVKAEGGPVLLERIPSEIEFAPDHLDQQIFAGSLRHDLDDLLLPQENGRGQDEEADLSASLYDQPDKNYRLYDRKDQGGILIMRGPIRRGEGDPLQETTGLVGLLLPGSWSRERLLEIIGVPLNNGRDSQDYPIMRRGGRLRVNASFGEDAAGDLFITVRSVLKEDLSDALELLVDLVARLIRDTGRQGWDPKTPVGELKEVIEARENRGAFGEQGFWDRFAAVMALLSSEDPEAVRTLLALIDPSGGRSDPSYVIRQAIVKGLADRHHMGRQPRSDQLRLTESHLKSEVRPVLTRILVGEKSRPEQRDPRPRVRWTAIQSLTRLTPIGSEGEHLALLEMAERRDPSPYVRREAGHMAAILKQQQVRLRRGEGPMSPIRPKTGPPSDSAVTPGIPPAAQGAALSSDPRTIRNEILFDLIWGFWKNSEAAHLPLGRLIGRQEPQKPIRLYWNEALGVEIERSAHQSEAGFLTLSAFLSEGKWDSRRMRAFLTGKGVERIPPEGQQSPPIGAVSPSGLPVSLAFSVLDTGLLIQVGWEGPDRILEALPVLVDAAVQVSSASTVGNAERSSAQAQPPEVRRQKVRERIVEAMTGPASPQERQAAWSALAAILTETNGRRDPDPSVRAMAARGLGLLTAPEGKALSEAATITDTVSKKKDESDEVRLAADEVFIRLQDAVDQIRTADAGPAAGLEEPVPYDEAITSRRQPLKLRMFNQEIQEYAGDFFPVPSKGLLIPRKHLSLWKRHKVWFRIVPQMGGMARPQERSAESYLAVFLLGPRGFPNLRTVLFARGQPPREKRLNAGPRNRRQEGGIAIEVVREGVVIRPQDPSRPIYAERLMIPLEFRLSRLKEQAAGDLERSNWSFFGRIYQAAQRVPKPPRLLQSGLTRHLLDLLEIGRFQMLLARSMPGDFTVGNEIPPWSHFDNDLWRLLAETAAFLDRGRRHPSPSPEHRSLARAKQGEAALLLTAGGRFTDRAMVEHTLTDREIPRGYRLALLQQRCLDRVWKNSHSMEPHRLADEPFYVRALAYGLLSALTSPAEHFEMPDYELAPDGLLLFLQGGLVYPPAELERGRQAVRRVIETELWDRENGRPGHVPDSLAEEAMMYYFPSVLELAREAAAVLERVAREMGSGEDAGRFRGLPLEFREQMVRLTRGKPLADRLTTMPVYPAANAEILRDGLETAQEVVEWLRRRLPSLSAQRRVEPVLDPHWLRMDFGPAGVHWLKMGPLNQWTDARMEQLQAILAEYEGPYRIQLRESRMRRHERWVRISELEVVRSFPDEPARLVSPEGPAAPAAGLEEGTVRQVPIEEFLGTLTPEQRSQVPAGASQVLVATRIHVYAQGEPLAAGAEERFRRTLPPEVRSMLALIRLPLPAAETYQRPGIILEDKGLGLPVANPLSLPRLALWLIDLQGMDGRQVQGILQWALSGDLDANVKVLGIMVYEDAEGMKLAIFV